MFAVESVCMSGMTGRNVYCTHECNIWFIRLKNAWRSARVQDKGQHVGMSGKQFESVIEKVYPVGATGDG